MRHSIKYIWLIILFSLGLFVWSCKSSKTSYPCPAYGRPSNSTDSTGVMPGGYRQKKDAKSGLIQKKKNKNLMDRKRAG